MDRGAGLACSSRSSVCPSVLGVHYLKTQMNLAHFIASQDTSGGTIAYTEQASKFFWLFLLFCRIWFSNKWLEHSTWLYIRYRWVMLGGRPRTRSSQRTKL